MVGIILASHGEFANGILQSGSMIFGEQQDVKAVTLQPSEGPDDLKAKIEEAIATFENQEQVLFLVDLWGGTPFNQSNGLIDGHEDTWAIVTGLNLPMLIEAYASRLSMQTAHEIAKHIVEVAREGVKVKPEKLEPVKAAPAATKSSSSRSNSGRNSDRRRKDQICTCTYRYTFASWTGSYNMDKDNKSKSNHRSIRFSSTR